MKYQSDIDKIRQGLTAILATVYGDLNITTNMEYIEQHLFNMEDDLNKLREMLPKTKTSS